MAEWTLPEELNTSANSFRDKFSKLSFEEWRDLLIASMTTPTIDGLEFPRFPPLEIQEQTHGSSGEAALREAAGFYEFVSTRTFFREKAVPGATLLDFGTGWGRIARFFLRDFDLDGLFGFDPKRTSCFLARSLSPYLCVLTGGEIPDQTLPPNRFDVVVGWSVFSHLSEFSTAAWLEEMARIMRPDGYCVMTTFGDRFLQLLMDCRTDLESGKEIFWYHRNCLEAAGDIDEQYKRYSRGEFVWLDGGIAPHYGQATLLHENALLRLVRARKLPFELVEFDRESLPMDVFTLCRR
jgi:SAM-dependent methyltransferase